MSNQHTKNSIQQSESRLLTEKKQVFSGLVKKVTEMVEDRRQKNGNSPSLQTIETLINCAIELIEQLHVLADTPRHIHGSTYRTDASNHSQNPTYNQHEHFNQHITHTSEESVYKEHMYRLGKDIIFSTSGQFVFQPKARLLSMTVGDIELSAIDAQKLYEWMKYDYKL